MPIIKIIRNTITILKGKKKMSDVYEFIISLKDQATAVTDKITSGVGQVAEMANRAQGTFDKVRTKAQSAFTKVYQSARTALKGSDNDAVSVST